MKTLLTAAALLALAAPAQASCSIGRSVGLTRAAAEDAPVADAAAAAATEHGPARRVAGGRGCVCNPD